MTINETLTGLDRVALGRAIEMYRTTFPTLRPHIDRQLAEGKDRDEVGRYCAHYLQVWNLRIGPWLVPPCAVNPDAAARGENRLGEVDAMRLQRRMLAAGLSKYEGHPMAALEQAERSTRAAP
ncbi:hypothetical protein I6F20_17060 [Bradyrhizobium sp. IC3123]|uniref:hypothetical protein n=1 Tax=Bradyrhizobium sp. IC3123 TaxID=2793803 RepID=UPI001CD67ADE|nr:hypothetical protein [Bradyrhizobium sp. IC3123]MCA1390778.1 hypothetical protein [Bradyrhizobium sp. IC3123]